MSIGFPGSSGAPKAAGPSPNYGPLAGAPMNASGGLMMNPQTMAAASGQIPGGQTAGRFYAYGPMQQPFNGSTQASFTPSPFPQYAPQQSPNSGMSLAQYQAQMAPKPVMMPAPLTAGQAPRVLGPVVPTVAKTVQPTYSPGTMMLAPKTMSAPKVAARR